MRVLICGSREWEDDKLLRVILQGFVCSYLSVTVIEGCARGADHVAEQVAWDLGTELVHFPADWDRDGKAAGSLRNQRMLIDGHPSVIVAFKDGFNAIPGRGGTEDMVRRARRAGLPTYVVSHGADV